MSIHTNRKSRDYYLEADVDPCQLPRAFSTPNVECYNLSASATVETGLLPPPKSLSPPESDSDGDENPAQPSVSRKNDFTITGSTDGCVLNVKDIRDKLADFEFDVGIADWGEICTALEMMKPMCRASPSNASLTYDGETETAGTPRPVTNGIQNEYLEENIARRISHPDPALKH
ncbi:hypothetical protein BU17DRAFT_70671 [Hysterangium stoloniferum]|nr:hypothetical protein BU17DRAFT_70671 [Hysterangium stoloniferum]